MTYAPADLLAVRQYLHDATGLSLAELGIVGDSAHAASGGYHEGRDDLVRVLGSDLRHSDGRYDYSVRQVRDRNALTNAASALDVGAWPGLRAFSIALAAACRAGDPRTAAVREVIYTDDGAHVRHWDAINEQSGGDDSHLWHTHISFWRNTDGTRAGGFLDLVKQIINGGDAMAGMTEADWALFTALTGGATPDGAVGNVAPAWARGFGGWTIQAAIAAAKEAAAAAVAAGAEVKALRAEIGAIGAATGANPEALRALVREEIRAAFADAGTPD